ncbi:MAG: hypothetical protein JWQ34_3554 [Mucilaginibacter sp.]|uniref:porin family protein n=1 Tax=Mucilaginibacter sp. TaxID=1882438 RepID=UPI00260F9931|nr:porin family protein [Mucilaginibacter sp.]MDB5005329.1 hypothetical protein [Mucilaginibacter sp.]
MKKIFLLATILLATRTLSAQTYLNSDRYDLSSSTDPIVAFTASASMTNTTGGANFNTSGLAGFSAGFAFDLPINNTLSITPEILYAQKGYSASTSFGNFTQRSQYIDIPVLAKFKAGSRISFYAGPQISYAISSSNSFSASFTKSQQQNYVNTSSNLLLQGVIGLGINVTNKVELRARYAIDMQGRNTNGNNIVPSYRNQAVQLGFGFKFG